MLDLVAPLFSLSAEYLKTRKEDAQARSIEDFQAWLREDVFPRLLEQSGQTLHSTIALRAAEHERFASIMELLQTIRQAVSEPTVADRWAELRPVDQVLLKHLHARTLDDLFVILDNDDLTATLHEPGETLSAAAQFLSERGLLEYTPYCGGWHVSLTRAGMELAHEVASPGSFEKATSCLGKVLSARKDDVARLDELSEAAHQPFALAYFVVSSWAERGLLAFQEMSPFEASSVYNVSETLRRHYATA